MPVVSLEVGAIGCCCYIVSPEGTHGGAAPCVVIDPGDEAGRISAEVQRLGMQVEMLLLTHAHFDHIGGVEKMLAAWPGAVLGCSAETSRRAGDPRLNLSPYSGKDIRIAPAGRILADGESFSAAEMIWQAVEVPGHEPGEMVYIIGDGHAIFSGDTVFAGSVGRSDFPGGDGELLIKGSRKLLESLPRDGVIYPGHGPSTEVGEELEYNPFLRG